MDTVAAAEPAVVVPETDVVVVVETAVVIGNMVVVVVAVPVVASVTLAAGFVVVGLFVKYYKHLTIFRILPFVTTEQDLLARELHIF